MASNRKASIPAAPTAPTATIGGSADPHAALTDQATPAALSLSAASVTAGATIAWTVYGPTDEDETANLITAGSTSATPTWAAFSAAAGVKDGKWTIKTVLTLDAQTTTYIRTVQVGDEYGFLDAWNHDYSADANYDWTTGAQDLDGVTHTPSAVTGGSTMNTVNGTGVVMVQAGAGAPTLFADIPDIYTGLGLTRSNRVRIWRRLNDNAFTVDGQRNITGARANGGTHWIAYWNERISGTDGFKCNRAGGTVQSTTGTGHAVVTCMEINDTQVRMWYSTAAWSGSWPALSSMTLLTVNSKKAVTAYDQAPNAALGFPIFTDGQFYLHDADAGGITTRLVQVRCQYHL